MLCIYSQGSLYTLSRPWNYKDLFNYWHALLRNHIEWIFGLFKRRFKVLLVAQEYNLKTQAWLIPALAVIHNFIHIHDPGDLPESEANYEGGNGDGDGDNDGNDDDDDVPEVWGARREKIAQDMWDEYQNSNCHHM